jgi:hypothetical protein
MSSTLQLRRGTRAELDSLALVNGLLVGEPFLLTDEARIAVAITVSTYQTYAKEGEVVVTGTLNGGTY